MHGAGLRSSDAHKTHKTYTIFRRPAVNTKRRTIQRSKESDDDNERADSRCYTVAFLVDTARSLSEGALWETAPVDRVRNDTDEANKREEDVVRANLREHRAD